MRLFLIACRRLDFTPPGKPQLSRLTKAVSQLPVGGSSANLGSTPSPIQVKPEHSSAKGLFAACERSGITPSGSDASEAAGIWKLQSVILEHGIRDHKGIKQ